jgi:hypothetical protein
LPISSKPNRNQNFYNNRIFCFGGRGLDFPNGMNKAHTRSEERIERMIRRLEHQARSPRGGMLLELFEAYHRLECETLEYVRQVQPEPGTDNHTKIWALGHQVALIRSIVWCMKFSYRTPGVTEGEIFQAKNDFRARLLLGRPPAPEPEQNPPGSAPMNAPGPI